MSRELVLRQYIDLVRHKYDYIIIDCMPSLGVMTVNALAAIPSKEVLIAQLLGMLQSPISGLARALQQVAEQKA